MKNINQYIKETRLRDPKFIESSGNSFKEEVKYSKTDWEKWLKLVNKEEFGKDLMIGNYESQPELTLVYKANHEKKMMDHIASYDSKKEILYCDDIKLFGNEA